MPTDHLLLTLIIIVVAVLFITRWIRIEVTALLTMAILPLLDLVELKDAFIGFSSPATITIACMFIMSSALSKTGALDFLKDVLLKHAGGSKNRLILLLATFVPLASAFINNTPVVVMLVPILIEISREMDVKPSRLLIPLSYLAILGGTCSLIGTNTNIIVHQLYRDAGGDGFGMFDFTPLGLVYLIGGVIFLVTVGQRLLPDRTSLAAMMSRKSTAKFVTELCLPEYSRHIGRTVAELLGERKDLRLLELVSGEEVVLALQAKDRCLEPGDALLVEGNPDALASFLAESEVELPSVLEDGQRVAMTSMELMLTEAVVLPASPFIGQTLVELGLNRNYGVKVLGVMRRGRHHRNQIRTMVLQPGDVLLIQAEQEGFARLKETSAVLIVDESVRNIVKTRHRRTAVGVLAGVVALAGLTPIELAEIAIFGVAVLLMSRCLRFSEALRSIDTTVVFILAGTLPLGLAMEQTGLANVVVTQLLGLVGDASPVVILSFFYLLTAVVTQILSNQACAVLLTPLAFGMAAQLNLNPEPLLMAICFGASASFMTPIGYATNTIVMGPGGYTFMDYVKIGVPLNVLTWVLATLLIPVFWPL